MGLGGAVIAALSTVICLKVPFSDGLGLTILLTTKLNYHTGYESKE